MNRENELVAGAAMIKLLVALGLSFLCCLSYAARLPWDSTKTVGPIAARDMPLQEFLQVLLAAQEIPVVVSPSVSQRLVNGRFVGAAERIFEGTIKSFSLLPYFDGTTLYIFSTSESMSRTISLSQSSAARVISTLGQLRLHDGRYNTFNAIPASGMIQVRGAKPYVDQVQDVVRSIQLSAVAAPDQIGVFPLKHAWANDVTLMSAGKQVIVPGVATTLRVLLGSPGTLTPIAPKARSTVQKLRGQGLNSQPNESSIAEEIADQPGASELGKTGSGKSGPTVTAEPRSNSVIVRDTPDRLPRYAELIKALDVEPVMIELETTIVDVNSDQLTELGINWRSRDSRNEIRLGRGNSSDLALASANLNDVTPTGRGLTWTTLVDRANLIARINLLAATGAARIVSRAQVATMANLESLIESNQTTYVRVGGFQEVDLFPVSASTSVRITPQLFTSGATQVVSMVVGIRDGRFSDVLVDQIPSVKEIALSTNGLVPENQTFVIGGFQQESKATRADKVPILGDLPFIGAAFRSTTESNLRTERLFMITPKVLTVANLIARASTQIPVDQTQSTHDKAVAETIGSRAARSIEQAPSDPALR
jgi:type III secretion protein C